MDSYSTRAQRRIVRAMATANQALRKVFWDTFNATREEDMRADNTMRAALNSLLPAFMKIEVGYWQIVALKPAGDSERNIGSDSMFVVDANGTVRSRVEITVDVADRMGAYRHIQQLTLTADFSMTRDGAGNQLIWSCFDSAIKASPSDSDGLQKLADVVLDGIGKQARKQAIALAGTSG